MDTSVEKRGRQYMYWLFDSILMAALVRVCCCTACSIQDVIALEGAFSHVNCCSSSAITTSIIYIYADASFDLLLLLVHGVWFSPACAIEGITWWPI